VARRSGSRVMPCAIHIVHLEETRSTGFPVWSQNRWRWFGGLGLKTTTTVSWFEPQNQVEEVCRFAPQNQWVDEDDARKCVRRESPMLHLRLQKNSETRVKACLRLQIAKNKKNHHR